jgi:hypothetical protein
MFCLFIEIATQCIGKAVQEQGNRRRVIPNRIGYNAALNRLAGAEINIDVHRFVDNSSLSSNSIL